MRNFVLATFLVTSLGAGFELFLLEHMEDIWQIIPLVLIGIGSALISWIHIGAGQEVRKMFELFMAITMLSGLLGIYFHVEGNLEFEREMYPAMSGFELIWKTLKGATPSLAPGTMVAIGMIGLLYTRLNFTTETDK